MIDQLMTLENLKNARARAQRMNDEAVEFQHNGLNWDTSVWIALIDAKLAQIEQPVQDDAQAAIDALDAGQYDITEDGIKLFTGLTHDEEATIRAALSQHSKPPSGDYEGAIFWLKNEKQSYELDAEDQDNFAEEGDTIQDMRATYRNLAVMADLAIQALQFCKGRANP